MPALKAEWQTVSPQCQLHRTAVGEIRLHLVVAPWRRQIQQFKFISAASW